VVGHEQVRTARLQPLQPRIGDAVGGAFDGAVEVHLDLRLQGVDRMDAGELAAQPLGDQRFQHPAHGPGHSRKAEACQNVEELPIGEQSRHHGRDFGVGIGSDGFEFVHHALC